MHALQKPIQPRHMKPRMSPEGENEQVRAAEAGVRCLLHLIGENTEREGLKDTPARFVKAFREMTAGLHVDPKRHLEKRFALDDAEESIRYDGVVLSGWLPFVSLCEHHLLPFTGEAHIAYLPAGKERTVVGLSKLARLLEDYARRPQIQERLTQQVADAIETVLRPEGVGVVLRGKHSCQWCRGVKKPGSMLTSSLHGSFKTPAGRMELFELIKLAKGGE